MYVIYFDAETRTFRSPAPREPVPTTWVPAAELLDAATLQEWVFEWTHGRDAALRAAVFEAGARLRDYRIPSYIVETDDESLLKDIFLRINKRGVDLEWGEVYDAMFGHDGEGSSTLDDLSVSLGRLGMGALSKDSLLGSIIATKGLDVTQNVSVHYDRDPDLLRNGARDALAPLQRALDFLRRDAEIPHVRLLPFALPVPILVRFFSLYPVPGPRVRVLLVRWLWRVILGATQLNRLTLLRRGVSSIAAASDEAAVQNLLELVRATPPEPYRLDDRFDARSSGSRLALLGMNSLGPRVLPAGEPVDVAALITGNDGLIRRVWDKARPTGDPRAAASSPANRILLPDPRMVPASPVSTAEDFGAVRPGQRTARPDLRGLADSAFGLGILESHGISADAARALDAGDAATFLMLRASRIELAVQNVASRLAGWERTDRSSIEHILETAAAA